MAHVLDAVIQLKDNFSSTIQTVEKNVGSFSRTAKNMGRDVQRVGKDLQSFGKTMTTHVTLPVVGAGTMAVKSFIDMEDAFSGVKKTIQGTPEQLQEIKKALDDMATVKGLPIARKELYGIAETAGQLGVERENIEGFTETIAKVGRITNLSYEQGSASLARFSNVMGMSMDDMDRLGSTIVHLDTNLATSASEIVDMGMRLAAAGKQANMSEADILGVAGALSSVGLESQAGGSAFSKVIQGMNDSVFAGGEELQKFAKVAGMSAGDFSTLFKQDASQAIATFVQGLGRVKEEGYNVSAVIEDLGFSEYRTRDALLRATEAGDLFVDSLSKANTAWAENTALNDVFATRTDNIKAQLEVLRNKFGLLAEQFGSIIIPHVITVVDKLGDLMERFSALDDTQKENIVRMAGVAAILGPTIGLLGKMTGGVGKLITEFGFFAGRLKNLGLMGALFTPGVKVVLILAAIAAGAILLIKNFDNVKDIISSVGSKFSEFTGITGDHARTVIDIFKNLGLNVWEILKRIGESFKPLLSTIGGVINQIIGIIKALMPVLMPILGFIVGVFIAKIIHGFMTLAHQVSSVITAIIGVINGLLTVLSGVINFIVGVFTGDWARAWDGVKTIFSGIVEIIKSIWQGIIDFLTAPVNAVVDILDAVFKDKVEGIKKAWEGLKNFFKNPIQGTVNVARKGFDWVKGKVGRNYKGTNYWKGGPTWVHEKGGEIIDLPRGTRIYPHDKSVAMAREQGRREAQVQSIIQKVVPANIPTPKDTVQTIRQHVVSADIREPISLQQPIERKIIPINEKRVKKQDNTSSSRTEINIPKLADQIIVREDADIDKIAKALARELEKAEVNTA